MIIYFQFSALYSSSQIWLVVDCYMGIWRSGHVTGIFYLLTFLLTDWHIKRNMDLPCWRQCGSLNAHHTHIFWSCEKFKPFWEDVHSVLNEVFGYKIPMTCVEVVVVESSWESLYIRPSYDYPDVVHLVYLPSCLLLYLPASIFSLVLSVCSRLLHVDGFALCHVPYCLLLLSPW